jgi:predicted sulfurtransferase
MRFYLSITIVLLLFVATQSACNRKAGDESRAGGANAQSSQNTQTQAAPPQDEVRRLGIAEVQAALEKGEAVVVDVRGSVEYKLGHIRGARSMPLGLIAAKAVELPKGKLIVTYCA